MPSPQSGRGVHCTSKHDTDGVGDNIVTTSHSSSYLKNNIKTELGGVVGEQSLEKDVCKNEKMDSVDLMAKVDVESAVLMTGAHGVTSNDTGLGSLSNELANIGHIDSSETSDDSPEGECETFSGNIYLT